MPRTRRQLAKMRANYAKFNDLPAELHIMIFRELIKSYTEELRAGSDTFRKEILPLCVMNTTWRTFIQEMSYALFTLRADRLPDFIKLAKANPTLLSYIQGLVITHVAGCSLDDDAMRREKAEKEWKLTHRRTRSGSNISISESSGEPAVVLKAALPTIVERSNCFVETWENLRSMLVLLVESCGGNIKLHSVKLEAGDMHVGRFNDVTMPQYAFVPLEMTAELKGKIQPLPLAVKQLIVEPEVLDNLELHPELVG